MLAARRKNNHILNSISRNTLNQQIILSIDAFLKSLRNLSRNATNTRSNHVMESHLLKKVYYKGRNQHGIALFWRNLGEVKRYAVKVEMASLPVLIDYIRSSFYPYDEANPTVWKTAPWRQMPAKAFLEDSLMQIKRHHVLYCKAADAHKKAYISFSRFANSTSFLPLSVTLLAMTARLYVLLMDLDNGLILLWQEVHKLLQSVDKSHYACKCKLPASVSTLDPSGEPTAEPYETLATDALQMDMGEVVPRPEESLPSPVIDRDSKQDSITLLYPVTYTADEYEDNATAHIAITNVTRTSPKADIAPESQIPKKDPKRRGHQSRTKPRDEIDLIFG